MDKKKFLTESLLKTINKQKSISERFVDDEGYEDEYPSNLDPDQDVDYENAPDVETMLDELGVELELGNGGDDNMIIVYDGIGRKKFYMVTPQKFANTLTHFIKMRNKSPKTTTKVALNFMPDEFALADVYYAIFDHL